MSQGREQEVIIPKLIKKKTKHQR